MSFFLAKKLVEGESFETIDDEGNVVNLKVLHFFVFEERNYAMVTDDIAEDEMRDDPENIYFFIYTVEEGIPQISEDYPDELHEKLKAIGKKWFAKNEYGDN